jgi:hypothetical protein
MNKHRKAVGVALDEMLFDGLDDDQRSALDAQNPDTWRAIQLNATEWLLAEGEILVKGEPRRVSGFCAARVGRCSPPVSVNGSRSWPSARCACMTLPTWSQASR